MSILVSLPVLGLLVILQSSIVSRVPLLYGTADLVILALAAWAVQERVRTALHWGVIGSLLVSIVSAVPLGAVLGGYLSTTIIASLLRQKVWQIRLLAMLAATFFGTLVTHGLTIFFLRVSGAAIPIIEAFNLITLPSVLLNLLIAVPMYAFISDLASWIYPEEIEI